MAPSKAHLALAKYWLTANLFRSLFFRKFAETNPTHLSETHGSLGLAYYWVSDCGILSSQWIAALYPMIEGYQALGPSDTDLDSLLQSKFLDDVRLYRNAVFHFQTHPTHAKHLPVLESYEAKEWIDAVHKGMGRLVAERILHLTVTDGELDSQEMTIALAQEMAKDDV